MLRSGTSASNWQDLHRPRPANSWELKLLTYWNIQPFESAGCQNLMHCSECLRESNATSPSTACSSLRKFNNGFNLNVSNNHIIWRSFLCMLTRTYVDIDECEWKGLWIEKSASTWFYIVLMYYFFMCFFFFFSPEKKFWRKRRHKEKKLFNETWISKE